jgi:hypothetical protein
MAETTGLSDTLLPFHIVTRLHIPEDLRVYIGTNSAVGCMLL